MKKNTQGAIKKLSLALLLSCAAVSSQHVVGAAAAPQKDNRNLVPLVLPVLAGAAVGAGRVGALVDGLCGSSDLGQLAANGLALGGLSALGHSMYKSSSEQNALTESAALVGIDQPVMINLGVTALGFYATRLAAQKVLGTTMEESLGFYRNVCIGAGTFLAVKAGYDLVESRHQKRQLAKTARALSLQEITRHAEEIAQAAAETAVGVENGAVNEGDTN